MRHPLCAALAALSLACTGFQQGPCGPGTCAGCCDASGVCVVRPSPEACGRSGTECQRCRPGTFCDRTLQVCARGFADRSAALPR